ncbi:hypothetical protein NKR23_g2142 [Pleurostoma richardsiae]|uniref:Uncharacterized protein n=1 Tax=Pleurostoma richardsiae TaxID=41990 RepID=A0AA38S2R2_9PEZI|nr:hypothetical protein NKR23_g2142 [Pleurostoma richardsiae]
MKTRILTTDWTEYLFDIVEVGAESCFVEWKEGQGKIQAFLGDVKAWESDDKDGKEETPGNHQIWVQHRCKMRKTSK